MGQLFAKSAIVMFNIIQAKRFYLRSLKTELAEFARFSSQFFLVETFDKLRKTPFQLLLRPRSCACSAFGDCRTLEPYYRAHCEHWLFRFDADIGDERKFSVKVLRILLQKRKTRSLRET